MADTIRETIIKSIITSLKSYSGFSTISEPTIVRGVEYFDVIETYDMPVISVLPRDDSIERQYGRHECTMLVEFVCGIAFDATDASLVGEAVYGELMVAALSSIPDSVQDCWTTGGGVVLPDSLNRTILSAVIEIEIQYLTDVGDPYTLTE